MLRVEALEATHCRPEAVAADAAQRQAAALVIDHVLVPCSRKAVDGYDAGDFARCFGGESQAKRPADAAANQVDARGTDVGPTAERGECGAKAGHVAIDGRGPARRPFSPLPTRRVNAIGTP